MIHDMIDQASYMAHGYCLLWKPWLVSLHAISDFLIFAAYFAIPVAIWIFVSKRPNVELKGLARLFAAFILWCGITHIINLVTLWWPIYEVQGYVKAITAGVSVFTAVMIFPLIPKALQIPSPNELLIANTELAGEIAAHKRTLAELEEAKRDLEARVEARTRELSDATDRFRTLFEHAPVAMLMADKSGTISQVNAAAEALFKSDKTGLVATSVDSLLPEVRHDQDLRHLFDDTARKGPMVLDRELAGRRMDGIEIPVQVGLNPVRVDGQTFVVASVLDISARRESETRMQFVMRELSHRSKNLLALVQGMLRQTLASAPDLKTIEKDFTARLQGLTRSHELLVASEWQGASISELVKSQLSFVDREGAINIEGPPMWLTPAAVQNIGLALHELATNALKHGALAVPEGTVLVAWQTTQNDSPAPGFRFAWTEIGGPEVSAPTRTGFGQVVLERVVPEALGGHAVSTFAPSGAAWILDAPLQSVLAADKPPSGPAQGSSDRKTSQRS